MNLTKHELYNLLEDVFVTALEGGSNYWYFLSSKAVKEIRSAVPKEDDLCLSTAIVRAIIFHDKSIEIEDCENEGTVLGTLSLASVAESVNKISKMIFGKDDPEGVGLAMMNVLSEGYDAGDADIIFQYLVMGEIVYG